MYYNKNIEKNNYFPYSVGALLYSPANNHKITETVISGVLGKQYSLALCLEDAISDLAVLSAEQVLIQTIQKLDNERKNKKFYMPKIFIRVRNPEQIKTLFRQMKESFDHIVMGFILPKFDTTVMEDYLSAFFEISQLCNHKKYIMPIIESQAVIRLSGRYCELETIKQRLDEMKSYILNIRVGGNDFCKQFGIRRDKYHSIYEIGCVRNIIEDIVTVFGREYVVSGAVWEYFDDESGDWRIGMEHELELDMLNGFIGKTVIHPNQIDVVNQALKVSYADLHDAKRIIKMMRNDTKFVEKSVLGERMNECKTQMIWAEKILNLAEIYGVKEECKKQRIVIPV